MGRAGGPNPARIAAIRGPVPRILMTRVRLQASTCRDISVATLGSLFIRKCVAPIRALMVPNGCSTVSNRPLTLLSEVIGLGKVIVMSASAQARISPDRKGVVQGKRVSGRVDTGGRRGIQK